MNTHTSRLILAVATIFCLFVSTYSHASSILFGATHDGRDGDSTLVIINPTTGTATSVGSGLGFERVSGLDFDPVSGLLYGTGERTDGSTRMC
jgi:DNA-binding beta-propeller fold protein YncE